VTVLFANCSFGQYFSDTAISIISKENLISKIRSNPVLVRNKLLNTDYTRYNIDFGVTIYSEVFNKEGYGKSFLGGKIDYRVVAYTTGDTIFMKTIYKLEEHKQEKGDLEIEAVRVFTFIDTTKLCEYISKHNVKYYSSWTVNDFLNRKSEYGRFGVLCGGIIPHITKEGYSIARLVKANDSIALRRLASSFSATERAFGSAGLYFLLLKVPRLSDELLDLISTNQESEISIHYCDGCISGSKTLAEALDLRNLKYLYQLLKESELL
jgi:hypothetical protein